MQQLNTCSYEMPAYHRIIVLLVYASFFLTCVFIRTYYSTNWNKEFRRLTVELTGKSNTFKRANKCKANLKSSLKFKDFSH